MAKMRSGFQCVASSSRKIPLSCLCSVSQNVVFDTLLLSYVSKTTVFDPELSRRYKHATGRPVSWLTVMPRAARISSTWRKLSGNLKSSQTAWLMISAGNRCPA
jgi:hypothetical protein